LRRTGLPEGGDNRVFTEGVKITLARKPCSSYLHGCVIHSFADARTADLWAGKTSARVRQVPPDVQSRAFKKLVVIDATEELEDLRQPPSNRLEKLKGDRAERYSIRVNDQWRICFRWSGGAHDVELTDYH
jgi:toxin HigB-1